MKKYSILMLALTLVFVACEENESIDPENENQDVDLVALVIEEIAWNSQLLSETLDKTAELIDDDTIEFYLNQSNTRTEFIRNMSIKSGGLFEKIMLQNNDHLQLSGVSMGYGIITEHRAEHFNRLFEKENPIQAYYDLLIPTVDQADEDHKDWIILSSYVDEAEVHFELPEDASTLTRRTARTLIELQEMIISLSEDQNPVPVIEDVIATNHVPQPLIGLLLPAVQKVRAPASASPEPFNTWIDSNIEQGINGGLNRDIIRRLQVVSLLSAIDLIMNEDYVRNHQDGFSVGVMQAQYDAIWAFIWNEYWVK